MLALALDQGTDAFPLGDPPLFDFRLLNNNRATV